MDLLDTLRYFVLCDFRNHYHEFVAASAVNVAVPENLLQNLCRRAEHLVACAMALLVVFSLEPVEADKENRLWHGLVAFDNLVHVDVHHVAVLDAGERVNGTHNFKFFQQQVVRDFGGEEIRRQLKGLLDLDGVFGVEVDGPHVAENLVVESEREEYDRFCHGAFERICPDGVLLVQLVHVVLVFDDNAGASAQGRGPGLRNLVESFHIGGHGE